MAPLHRSGLGAVLVTAALGALAGACADPPSREERAVVLLERMAAAFERHGDGDCDALADALAETSKDADGLAALSEVDRTDASRRRLTKLQARIDAATTTIVAHAKKCGGDPRVSKALSEVLGTD